MTTWRNSRLGVVALVFTALLISACSFGSDEQGDPPPPSNPPLSISTESEQIDPSAPAITYTTELGFIPKRLEIEPGQQVRFVNESDKSFWPASNIHPTHTIYPELDAKTPISPNETWALTFNTRGFWRFHNHLAPEKGGLVVVLGEDDGPPPEPLAMEISDLAFEEPKDISPKDYVNLFKDDTLMIRFIKKYGPANTVRVLKEGENYFEVDCHRRAHDLGRAAFDEFGAAAFALSGHECQAGSFHGATEALFSTRGTVNLENDVAAICSLAPNPFFRHQCVHGVGHGLLAWTTYELHDALPLCERMPTAADQGSCYSGVFMENVVGGLSGKMGHITEYLKDDDPVFPCNVVDEKFADACYFYQTSHMLKVFDRDFSKVAQACAEAPSSAYQNCFQSYGRDVGNATRKDPAKAIEYCNFAPAGQNRTYCIEGAAQDRFWEESGADDALTMCRLVTGETEKSACYWTIIVRARDVFPTQVEFDTFCVQVEEKWRNWCDNMRSVPAVES
jgi:plastocyanin